MPNEIPAAARSVVMDRDYGCVRCGQGRATDVHHRRSRSVPGEHQHCPCNLIRLCRTCHTFVHRAVTKAQEEGFIVSRYVAEPSGVPLRSGGWLWLLDCRGNYMPWSAKVDKLDNSW